MEPWAAPNFPSHHVIHHADSRKWTVTGIIAEASGTGQWVVEIAVIEPATDNLTIALTC